MDLPEQGRNLAQAIRTAIDEATLAPITPSLGATLNTLNANLDALDNILLTIQREMAHQQARHIAEKDALKAEIHCESVDREANAARVAERQRFLFERSVALPGQVDAADRASASASFVEAALASLCPHGLPPVPGCAALCSPHD